MWWLATATEPFQLLQIILLLFAGIVAAWPGGQYGLPMPKSGCPKAKNFQWETGTRTQQTERGSHASDTNHLAGMEATKDNTANRIVQTFCMKKSYKGDGDYDWQKGKYCIYREGRCPDDFEEGYIYWDDATPIFQESTIQGHTGSCSFSLSGHYCVYKYGPSCPSSSFQVGWIYWDDAASFIWPSRWQNASGDLPDGDYDRNTKIYYCCRTDGYTADPIHLPTNSPFYLLKFGSQCQQVLGMDTHEEWVYWADENTLNLNTAGGTYPKVLRAKYPYKYTKLYYCYYTLKAPNTGLATALTVIYILAGIVGLVLLIFLLVCLIQRCCRCRRKKRGEDEEEEDEEDEEEDANQENSAREHMLRDSVIYKPSILASAPPLTAAIEMTTPTKKKPSAPPSEGGGGGGREAEEAAADERTTEYEGPVVMIGADGRPWSQPPSYDDVLIEDGRRQRHDRRRRIDNDLYDDDIVREDGKL